MIPSWDDLTPGIPDVLTSETVRQLGLFLRHDGHRKREAREPASTTAPLRLSAAHHRSEVPATLYACLRMCEHVATPSLAKPSDALLAIAREFSPRVMRLGDTEVLLDVSGLGRLIGEPPRIAAELSRAAAEAVLEHRVRVAIAPTQTAARLMAAAGGTCTPDVVTDDPASALARLPVTCLPPLETLPPGMDARDRARPSETLDRWGIATLGALAALPAADLSSRLGRRGVALQRLARGWDPRPFLPDPGTLRYIERLELEWPLDALEPLSFVFARLLDPLAVALERADRGAVAVRLDLRLTDRATHARVLPLPAPIRDPRVLRTLLLLDLESHPPPAAVDVVTIELDPAPARITQFSLLARALPSPETLSTLTARLSALVGASRIGSAGLVDTHQPGAFAMTRFIPDSAVSGGGHAITPDLAAFGERFGAPAAAFGGGGKVGLTGGSVLRRQRIPPAIRVSVARGRPVFIAASRRGLPSGVATEAAGPWRASGGWWAVADACRAEGMGPVGCDAGRAMGADACRAMGIGHGESDACRAMALAEWNHDEWDVAVASGAVCRIFQDRATGRWFLEGVYD